MEVHAQQITHYINRNYSAHDDTIEGAPHIIDFPFKCVEGDLRADWGHWADGLEKNKGTKCNHQQFAILMNFRVVSVDTYTEEYADTGTAVLMNQFEESSDKELD